MFDLFCKWDAPTMTATYAAMPYSEQGTTPDGSGGWQFLGNFASVKDAHDWATKDFERNGSEDWCLDLR